MTDPIRNPAGRTLWALALISLSGLAGCTTLPDVGPFAEATAELRSAVTVAGSTVESELRSMHDGGGFADAFSRQWATRVTAVTGMSEYADSLAGVVAAANGARANVGAVAENVKTLASTAGIALPASGAVDLVTEAGQFIYGQYALARAATTLEQALEAAQPAVERIAVLIAADLRTTLEILIAANTDLDQSLRTDPKTSARLGFRGLLVAERDAIYARSAGPPAARDATRLTELDRLIATTGEWYDPLQAERARIRARRVEGERLVSAAITGVNEWAMAHRGLVAAIKDRRPYSARSLAEAATELRSIIARMKEL